MSILTSSLPPETTAFSKPVFAYAARRIHDPSCIEKKNHLIVLEGLDGVGKTTTTQSLAEALKCKAWSSPINQISRETRGLVDATAFQTPLQRFDFYLAANLRDSKEFLEPTLQAGESVILDRYSLSTVVGNLAIGAMLDDHPSIMADPNVAVDVVLPSTTILLTLNEQNRQKRVNERAAKLSKPDKLVDQNLQVQERSLILYRSLIPYGLLEVDITDLNIYEVVEKIIDNFKLSGIKFS